MKVLWAQDQTKNGRVLVEKVEGTLNTADIGTKPVEETTLPASRKLGLYDFAGGAPPGGDCDGAERMVQTRSEGADGGHDAGRGSLDNDG